MLAIQKKTAERFKEQADLQRHNELIAHIDGIAKNNTVMIHSLSKFLSGLTTKTEVVNQLRSISTPDMEKVVAAIDKLEMSMANKSIDWEPVLSSLSNLEQYMSELPKELPEAPEAVVVDFTSTNSKLENIETAVKNLKLVVPAPIIDVKVPKTQITVEKVDLADLKQPLLDILGAFQSFSIPEPIITDLTTVEELLKTANDILKKIEKKPAGGGGGGGGGMVSFKDPTTGSSIQVPTNTDYSLPVRTKAQTERYDVQGTTIYTGAADLGSSESDSVWEIIKYDLSNMASASGKVARNASWSDRASGVYI